MISQADQLWNKLLNKNILKRGYHLARNDAKNNFIHNSLEINAFAADLDNRITELLYRIRTNTLRPHPLLNVEIPKTSLAIRFGSVISFEDSVILHTILYLIAPIIDRQMSSSVYSYRIKDYEKYEKSDEIFKESGQFNFPIPKDFLKIAEFPFLKSKTIFHSIDIFDPWYANWPEFDLTSKETFKKDGYHFMVVTDIVAYFDNIHLSILKDVLLNFLPGEQKIINLLLEFLEAWICKTNHGMYTDRGIPQGNQVSSFLGNVFLKDLDQSFDLFCQEHSAKYFRYMDDVRIFTKTEQEARLALLKMNRILRRLHLNIQSSKTKILREIPRKEISKSLIDDRFDSLNNLLQSSNPFSYRDVIRGLLYKKSKYGEEPVLHKKHNQGSLNSINSRLFRRWAGFCIKGKFPDHIERLKKEIKVNPDPRITKVAIQTIKTFPHRWSFVSYLLNFIQSDINVFPQQEAEIIKGARYLCVIPKEVIIYCRHNIFSNPNTDFYVKLESLKLLMCVGIPHNDFPVLKQLFSNEDNIYLKGMLAIAMLTIPSVKENLLEAFFLHPNNYIREIAQYMWKLQHNQATAKQKLQYIFQKNDLNLTRERIIDNIAELWMISNNEYPEVLQDLRLHLHQTGFLRKKYTIVSPLQTIFTKISKKIR